MSYNAGSDPTLQKRIQEINEKERRVKALEKELDDFESDLKLETKGIRPIKNWPCKSYAFARNAIDLDIPIQFQKATRKFYSLWWLTAICNICNWIAIVWWAGTYPDDSSFKDYLFVTLYVIIGVPLSWMLLYKRFYKAMQENGALGSLFFFFMCMSYILYIYIYMLIY